MKNYEKLKYCSGCEDNFYNSNNPYGIKECWCLKTARLIWRKKVSVDQYPPWTQKAGRFLSCYHQKRYVFVKPKQLC